MYKEGLPNPQHTHIFALFFLLLLSFSELKHVQIHNTPRKLLHTQCRVNCMCLPSSLTLCFHLVPSFSCSPFPPPPPIPPSLQMHLLTAHIDDLTAEVAAPLDRLVSVALQASRTSGMAKEQLMKNFQSKETFINDQLDEVRWVHGAHT